MNTTERFPPKKPEDLTEEERKLYDELEAIRVKLFPEVFVLKQSDGSFAGPFETAYETPHPFIQFLKIGETLSKVPTLPKHARETAILVTGSHFNSGYEIYAHERLARLTGLSWAQIDCVKTGVKPDSNGPDALDAACDVAFDVAVDLLKGEGARGRLKDEIWERAVGEFGKQGALTLLHYVGYYSYTCIVLNGAGVGIPAGEKIHESQDGEVVKGLGGE